MVITGNEYFSVFYLSEESEKTVLCVDDHYIKTGEMRQTKSFVSKLLNESVYKTIRCPMWMPDFLRIYWRKFCGGHGGICEKICPGVIIFSLIRYSK